MSDGRRPLVICYGNRLRGDDGVAWHVAERLAADSRLAAADVLCAHQLTPELALDVSRASAVVLVDAAAGGVPGTVRRQPVTITAGSSALPAWSHGLTPDTLARLAAALYDGVPPIEVVTVAGASFGGDEHLSAPVAAAVTVAAEIVAVAVTAFAPASPQGPAFFFDGRVSQKNAGPVAGGGGGGGRDAPAPARRTDLQREMAARRRGNDLRPSSLNRPRLTLGVMAHE